MVIELGKEKWTGTEATVAQAWVVTVCVSSAPLSLASVLCAALCSRRLTHVDCAPWLLVALANVRHQQELEVRGRCGPSA